MITFTLIYGLFALFLLVALAVVAYFLRGWKAAILTCAIAFSAMVLAFFVLIALITRNM